MNVGHYGNAFDVFKWSWLIEFARRFACDHVYYLALQTTVPMHPSQWMEPKLGSDHPLLGPKVADFFRQEHHLFARGKVRPSLNRLARLPQGVAGISMVVDARPYRLSTASEYFDGLPTSDSRSRVLLVIDPDNGLYDPTGEHKGFCKHGNDRHVAVDHVAAAVERIRPRAVTLTQYNTRKKGCFDDLRRVFTRVGRDANPEFRIFRGRVALAMATPKHTQCCE